MKFKCKCRLQLEPLELRRMLAADTMHLVLVTHGWNGEASGWPTEMRSAIANQISSVREASLIQVDELAWHEDQARLPHAIAANDVDELWEVASFDWEEGASTFLPTSAGENAADIGARIGVELASQGYDSVHVIAHSAGSWLINGLVGSLEATSPDTWTHATFLDAFTPGEQFSGSFGATADWAEHYVHDGWLPSTNERLTNAVNIDLTLLGPSSLDDISGFGVPGHSWPWEWYLQTTKTPFASDSHGLGFARSPAATSDIQDLDLRGEWITVGRPGDSNDDGRFDTSDLIQIFQIAKYDSEETANWQEGDWNQDGRFDSGDLILAFREGTFSFEARFEIAAALAEFSTENRATWHSN